MCDGVGPTFGAAFAAATAAGSAPEAAFDVACAAVKAVTEVIIGKGGGMHRDPEGKLQVRISATPRRSLMPNQKKQKV